MITYDHDYLWTKLKAGSKRRALDTAGALAMKPVVLNSSRVLLPWATDKRRGQRSPGGVAVVMDNNSLKHR